jgi:hypothetical protein
MGTDILPGHQYTDGEFINGPSLTEHVSEATIKPTFYSSRAAKDPVVLTDEFLVRDRWPIVTGKSAWPLCRD